MNCYRRVRLREIFAPRRLEQIVSGSKNMEQHAKSEIAASSRVDHQNGGESLPCVAKTVFCLSGGFDAKHAIAAMS
jgi:hypothetical protein